jgi:hypothetical protein
VGKYLTIDHANRNRLDHSKPNLRERHMLFSSKQQEWKPKVQRRQGRSLPLEMRKVFYSKSTRGGGDG